MGGWVREWIHGELTLSKAVALHTTFAAGCYRLASELHHDRTFEEELLQLPCMGGVGTEQSMASGRVTSGTQHTV